MIIIKDAEKRVKFENAIRVKFNYNAEIVAKIKEMPRRWYVSYAREWEIPKQDLSLLLEKFKGYEVDIKGVRKEGQRESIKHRLEGIKPIIDFKFKTKPFPHQIEAFNVGLSKSDLLLADEQGLGKTKESIDIAIQRKIEGVKKCLIVCGVNSVKYNWQEEIKIHSNEESKVFDEKSMEKRIYSINEWIKDDIYFGIINIESIRNKELVAVIKKYIKKGVIRLVIVDEIHKAKNGQNLQGKALRTLESEYKIGLTGTPIMNKAEDLWNILKWLGVDVGAFSKYKNEYCIMGGFRNYKVIGYKNLDLLNEKLNSVMLRRKKEDVLDLPPKIRKVEYIVLGEKQRILYNQIKQGLLEEIGDILLNPSPLSALIRLRQVTGGILGEEKDKINRLKEILEDIQEEGGKAIVFSNWKTVTKEIYKQLSPLYKVGYIDGDVPVLDRQKEVNKFQEDKLDVMIGTIGAMGTGLTLNKANYVIFMDKDYSPSNNEQAEDRSHRIGVKNTVNVISLVAKDTIDERIEEILAEKKDIFLQVVEGEYKIKDSKEILEYLLK